MGLTPFFRAQPVTADVYAVRPLLNLHMNAAVHTGGTTELPADKVKCAKYGPAGTYRCSHDVLSSPRDTRPGRSDWVQLPEPDYRGGRQFKLYLPSLTSRE